MTEPLKGLKIRDNLPENPAEIAALSGMPPEHQNRTVSTILRCTLLFNDMHVERY